MNNSFRNFMLGRYGMDQLSMVLLMVSVFLALLAQLVGFPLFAFISYIPLGISIFRILSKNIAKRRMENYKFVMLASPVYSWLNKTRSRVKDIKTHRFFKCPNCRVTLRLPKGKGKVNITCPKCKAKFSGKT
ncbi:MAG: hypothetical protein ACOYJ1_16255 [Peptococcales bacterium]|jgi:hypothetical protein